MKQSSLSLAWVVALAAALCITSGHRSKLASALELIEPATEDTANRQSVGSLLSRVRRDNSNNLNQRKKNSKSKKAFEIECLAAHNKWRRLHGAKDLQIDPKLTAFAQKRADHIAESDGSEFKHPSDLEWGENLAWHSRATRSCAELVRMWYDEVELYDWKQAQFTHETGHFTQLVWRQTERVGCARAFSSGPKGGIYLVCNYDPPGNFLGEERENVLPANNNGLVTQRPPEMSSSSSSSPFGPTTTIATAPTTLAPATTRSSVVGVPVASVTTTTTQQPSSLASTSKKPKKNKNKNKNKNKKNKNKNKKNNKNKNKNKNKKKNKNKRRQQNATSTTATPTTTTVKPVGG